MISDCPEKTLPHRDPFIWVTRLMERDEQGAHGIVELDVREDLDLFKGHFPGHPIFPGVIQIEAAAQACMWAHLGDLDGKNLSLGLFVAVDTYKFKKPVEPKTTLRLHCQQNKVKGGLQHWSVEIKSQDDATLFSKGTFWVKMGEPLS
jgi:3-hydroxyacyl-[acyl-carrier-protein] dehydratase